MAEKLTPKQMRYAEARVLLGLNQKESAMAAGVNEHIAKQAGYRWEKTPYIQDYMEFIRENPEVSQTERTKKRRERKKDFEVDGHKIVSPVKILEEIMLDGFVDPKERVNAAKELLRQSAEKNMTGGEKKKRDAHAAAVDDFAPGPPPAASLSVVK